MHTQLEVFFFFRFEHACSRFLMGAVVDSTFQFFLLFSGSALSPTRIYLWLNCKGHTNRHGC